MHTLEDLLPLEKLHSLRALGACAVTIASTPEAELKNFFNADNFEYIRMILVPILQRHLQQIETGREIKQQLLKYLMAIQVLIAVQAERSTTFLFDNLINDEALLQQKFALVNVPFTNLAASATNKGFTIDNCFTIRGTLTITHNCFTISGTLTITNNGTITAPPAISDFEQAYQKYKVNMHAWNFFFRACFTTREHLVPVIKPNENMAYKRNGKPLTYVFKYQSGLRPEGSKKRFNFESGVRSKILEFLAPDILNPFKVEAKRLKS